MRPTKLGPHVIEAFKTILEDDYNVLCGTDDDLLHELNCLLTVEEQISYRSFQRYKAAALEWGMDDEYTFEDEEANEYYDPVYQQLYKLFRCALFRQKKILMRRMIEDEKHWRKWQWILERKFREWNLRWSSMEAVRTQKKNEEEENKAEPQEEEIEERISLVPVYVTTDGREYKTDKDGNRIWLKGRPNPTLDKPCRGKNIVDGEVLE